MPAMFVRCMEVPPSGGAPCPAAGMVCCGVKLQLLLCVSREGTNWCNTMGMCPLMKSQICAEGAD